MNQDNRPQNDLKTRWGLLFFYWLILLLAALWLRPLIPVDETRYLSVAWEMWRNGDFLVPHLNGETYAHKPPLLFWLMHLGWWFFGVNETWPRLISPLVSLACLYLVQLLARRLWPQQPQVAVAAPWLLFGSFVWLLFYTLVQFDMLLVLCTLLGMLGLVDAGRGRAGGWWLLALAMGLGLLAKGPVILLHLLPAGLLGPLWVRGYSGSWGGWYGRLFLCVFGGAVMVLAWAIPAGIQGGEAYRNAIFWGQTANRVVNSFAHREPWWWYLPMLPVLLLPWFLWPRLWKVLGHLKAAKDDQGLRFLASWILSTLVLFSLVSGKQIKYLLPTLPALALVLAWLYAQSGPGIRRRMPDLAVLMLLVSGVLLLGVPYIAYGDIAWWIPRLSPLWGGVLLGAGILALWLPNDVLPQGVPRIAAAAMLMVLCFQSAMMSAGGRAYDLRGISQQVRQYQDQGRQLAYIGKYHGQFNFLGRLQHPVKHLNGRTVLVWARKHPNDLVIINDVKERLPLVSTVYATDYRGHLKALKILQAKTYLKLMAGS
ncbi:ArnT family glycosyltransferase [Thiolapillus brandeum]|uniref:Glycosyl transferase family 39 n=1 Tax=Thiolapillus brandeum TaxID=1076588 RepID=A0A7U6GJB2_9GAMM|nr:glycosyltransferase family 39 protein [Thiolapillus brandeum]BAO44731.1 glycosyl transferase family 39 [Thiolapillus brandeum]